MNTIYDLQAAQLITGSRIAAHREPITLGRPKRARAHRQAHEINGFLAVLQSIAHAVVSFLV